MNDLVTPFLGVFLSEHLPGPPEKWSEEQLTEVREDDVREDVKIVLRL
jgi:hypothetical protein